MSMQPVTPLRQQQHQQHNLAANSRPRRSINSNSNTIEKSSSRRSSRLQAANDDASKESRFDYMDIMNIPPVPPTPPPRRRDHLQDTTATTTATATIATEDSLLAPPLALLSRKRTRSEAQAEEDEAEEPEQQQDETNQPQSTSVTLNEAQAQIKKLAEYMKANKHDIYNGSKRESSKQAVLGSAKVNQGVEEALRQAFDEENDGTAMQEDRQTALDELSDLRDLFANGRALYHATTTSLAAPAEIPSKKPRLTRDQASAIEASTSKRPAATQLDNALATPKQTARAATDTASRRPTSKRTAAVTAATAISNNSTSKRRSATRTTAASTTITKPGGSATRRGSKVPRDEESRRRQQEEDALDWKKKYKRAFKTFVFYFDGFDAARKREAEKCVKDLGAQVESFFSKQVSHVVTTRPIPLEKPSTSLALPFSVNANPIPPKQASIFQAPGAQLQASGKENAQRQHQEVRNSSESPLKQTAAARDAFAGPSRRSKTRLGAANPNNMMYPVKTPPKIKAFADFDKTESKDILVKAQSFGMKLWNVEKLQRVLERLMSDDSPSQNSLRQGLIVNNAAHLAAGHAFNLQMNGNAPRPSLPSLLRAEALTGSTYERDLNALRPDFHYFNPKNGYILVEDSSGEFQPAHAKEYAQRIYSKSGEEERDTEWPTLWGGQEGRQAFYKPSSSYRPSLPSLELIRSNDRGCAPTMTASTISHTTNKQSRPQGSQVQDPPSYLAASGNSQIITSNIQSGTSTRSGQVLGANGTKVTGSTLSNGYIVDKRLARLGSKNAHIVTIGNNNTYLQQVSTASTTSVATASHSGSVATELAKRAVHKAGVALKEHTAKLQALIKAAPKPEPKKPGYCENCRVRFDDFKIHTRTKKHRRFALDQSNWTQLDELFSKIKRPINPELLELYADADMQNDIPSDIEASDKEEEEEYSEDDDMGEEDDSGFACMSFDYMPAAYQDPKNRRTRSKDAEKCDCTDCNDFYVGPKRYLVEIPRGRPSKFENEIHDDEDEEEDEDENEDDDDDDDDREEAEHDNDEVVDTSEEEEALETASEDEDVCEDEE